MKKNLVAFSNEKLNDSTKNYLPIRRWYRLQREQIDVVCISFTEKNSIMLDVHELNLYNIWR